MGKSQTSNWFRFQISNPKSNV